MNKEYFLIVVPLIILLLLFAVLIMKQGGVLNRDCALDAKLCPDGSFVDRVAPSCNFAPCLTKGVNLVLDKKCRVLPVDSCIKPCELCPPCQVCSSLVCHDSSFCQNIGFEKGWFEKMQKNVEKAAFEPRDINVATLVWN